MRKLIISAAIALAGVFVIGLAACNDDVKGTDPVLSVNPTSIEFEAVGGSINVTADGADWKAAATTGADWIKVSPVSGVAGDKFTVIVEDTAAEREGVITVTNTVTDERIEIPVKQIGPDPVLSVKPAYIEFTSEGGSSDVTADGADWEAAATTGADWIVISPASGVAGGKFTVTVEYTASGRDGVITVTNAATGEQTDVIVKQLGLEPATVYIAGNSNNRAVIWVDGEERIIGEEWSEAYSIDVSGDDIYVAGMAYNTQRWDSAVLWKNGEAQFISANQSTSSKANAVTVSGDDIYVVGREYNIDVSRNTAMLWINGEPQTLSTEQSEALAVYVSEGDVYVVGYIESGEFSESRAVLWKNNIVEDITEGINAFGIHGSGSDVYVAGVCNASEEHAFMRAGLWENGAAQTLAITNGPLWSGQAASVFISRGNVYAAGKEAKYNEESGLGFPAQAVLWANGMGHILSDLESDAASVFVYGDNVYVAGYVRDDVQKATLWKDNAIVWQSDVAGSTARSVVGR